jgi:PAS domain-containing protein
MSKINIGISLKTIEAMDSVHFHEVEKLREVIDILKTENARLREALEKISQPASMWDGFGAKLYWNIAREALGDGK